MATKKPDVIPVVEDLDDMTESINILVYADPGTGKTVLAGTGDVGTLIISFETGTISARRMGSKAKTVRVRNYREFAYILNEIRRTGGFGTMKTIEWLVIDTITELQMIVREGVIEAPADGKSRATGMQIQDYGEEQRLFKKIVHGLNDLPCHVLYTAHAMRTEDEEMEPIILPDLTGKWGTKDTTTASRWVSGTVHSYGYLKVVTKDDKEVRRWMFKRSGPYFGKDRYGVLAPYVDNPNLREIEKRILASNTPEEG